MGAGDRDIPGRHHRGRPTPPGHGQRVVCAERRTQTIETQQHRRHHHPATTITFTHSTPPHLCQPTTPPAPPSPPRRRGQPITQSSHSSIIVHLCHILRHHRRSPTTVFRHQLHILQPPHPPTDSTQPPPDNRSGTSKCPPGTPADNSSRQDAATVEVTVGPRASAGPRGSRVITVGNGATFRVYAGPPAVKHTPARDALPPAHTRRTGFTVAPTKSI